MLVACRLPRLAPHSVREKLHLRCNYTYRHPRLHIWAVSGGDSGPEHSKAFSDDPGENRGLKFKRRKAGEIGPNIAAAYEMSLEEARSLGIPEYALPKLSLEPTLKEARDAEKKIQQIIASFTSADL